VPGEARTGPWRRCFPAVYKAGFDPGNIRPALKPVRQTHRPQQPFRLRRTPRSNLFGGNFPNLPENAIFAADKSTL